MKILSRLVCLWLAVIILFTFTGCPISFGAFAIQSAVYTDKQYYAYDEEILVRLDLTKEKHLLNPMITSGNLHIKIDESPYYDIVGESEIKVNDYYKNEFHDSHSYIFKIKVSDHISIPQAVNIRLKFDLDKSYKCEELPNYDGSNEYFFLISGTMLIADSQGVIITQESKGFSLGSAEQNSLRLLNESINREYNGGYATADDCIDRLVEYHYGNKVYIKESVGDGHLEYEYISPRLRAKVYCDFGELGNLGEENGAERIALTILDALYKGGMITESEYLAEKAFISDHGSEINPGFTPISDIWNKEMVPIDDSFYNCVLDLR